MGSWEKSSYKHPCLGEEYSFSRIQPETLRSTHKKLQSPSLSKTIAFPVSQVGQNTRISVLLIVWFLLPVPSNSKPIFSSLARRWPSAVLLTMQRHNSSTSQIYSVQFVNKELLGIVRLILWDINNTISSNINLS